MCVCLFSIVKHFKNLCIRFVFSFIFGFVAF